MDRNYDLEDIMREFASDGGSRNESCGSVKAPDRFRPVRKKPDGFRRQAVPAPRRHKCRSFVIPVAALLFILIAAVSAGLCVTFSHRAFPNVRVGEVPVGGHKYDDVLQLLKDTGWEDRACSPLKFETYFGIETDIDPVSAGTMMHDTDASAAACRYGKNGNVFQNLLRYLKCISQSVDVNELNSVINYSYIDTKIAECERILSEAVGTDSFMIDESIGSIVMVKGITTASIDRTAARTKIIAALKSGIKAISYKDSSTDLSRPDFAAMHEKVCADPADAQFACDGSRGIIDAKPGYMFSISEAESLWNSAMFGDEIHIPLEVTHSPVTAEYLKSMMFHDMLGAVTTKYNNSNENRSSNVRLAASKIDGTILYPGEEFSFNNTVGERTAETGFMLAPAYAGYDDIKEELGGGVCQVSTGVYAAALFSFLDITHHTCHIYPPNYIQLGTDATVTIPENGGRSIDLRILNSRNWPIKIVSYCNETEDSATGKPRKTVTVEIWGTLEENDYMPVEFDNSYSNIYDYDRIIAPAYEGREGYKIKLTHDESEFEDDYGKGLRTATHRKVFDHNGNIVEDFIINPTYSAGYALDTYYYRYQ